MAKNFSQAGQFLKQIRTAHGETQATVYSRIGDERRGNYPSRVESGQIKVSPGNLELLARCYRLTDLEKMELRRISQIEGEPDESRVEVELLYQLIRISKEARERVIKAAIAYTSSENK